MYEFYFDHNEDSRFDCVVQAVDIEDAWNSLRDRVEDAWHDYYLAKVKAMPRYAIQD